LQHPAFEFCSFVGEFDTLLVPMIPATLPARTFDAVPLHGPHLDALNCLPQRPIRQMHAASTVAAPHGTLLPELVQWRPCSRSNEPIGTITETALHISIVTALIS
jgi:hypothetical protein